jgi:hypothetical protein
MTIMILDVLIMMIVFFLLLYTVLPRDIFALSPSFAPQEIINNHNYWAIEQVPHPIGSTLAVMKQGTPPHSFKLAKNTTECEQRYTRPPGISAVTYLSDGKTLNATLWLSYPLIQPPSNASAWLRSPFMNIPWYRIVYYISIHVHSAYGTPDYVLGIEWNVQNDTWTKILEEESPLGNIKVLNQKYNYTVPIGKQYIDFSFDLRPLNYPNLYDILFYENDFYVKNGYFCRMIDMASRVYVPPPEFSITALPSTIILRPGDETNMELQLKSNISIKSQVSLSVNRSNDIQTSIVPRELFLPPNGISTPTLIIKASEGAKPHPYTLPIIANFSIPTEANSITTTVANTLTTQTASGSNTAFTVQVSNLTLTVQPRYTIPEQLNNFVTSWITPITGLWSFLAGVGVVIAPMVSWLLIRRKKK